MMALSAFVSIWFVIIIKPTNINAFFFFASWLISPYLAMSAALIFLRPKDQPSRHWFVVATIVSAGGILLLSDVVFWHKDAQGAIAMLLVPIFQGVAFVVLLPLAMWVSRYVCT